MTEVLLTAEEAESAASVGRARFRESVAHGRKDTMGVDSEQSHVWGAVGELVVAKSLGVEWSRSINTFKGELDVAGYEVRTRSTLNGELIIRKNDADDRMFVLVVPTREKLRFLIAGMMRARMAKQGKYWREDRGHPFAWFVPQQDLIPFYVGVGR